MLAGADAAGERGAAHRSLTQCGGRLVVKLQLRRQRGVRRAVNSAVGRVLAWQSMHDVGCALPSGATPIVHGRGTPIFPCAPLNG